MLRIVFPDTGEVLTALFTWLGHATFFVGAQVSFPVDLPEGYQEIDRMQLCSRTVKSLLVTIKNASVHQSSLRFNNMRLLGAGANKSLTSLDLLYMDSRMISRHIYFLPTRVRVP
eukprot:scaffold1143_cov96-Cylindrotheca_fusiformis.AAC.10